MTSNQEPPKDSNAGNEGEDLAFVNNPSAKPRQPKFKKPIKIQKKGPTKVSRGKLDPAELFEKFKDEDDDLWDQIQSIW